MGMAKGLWSPDEDEKLRNAVMEEEASPPWTSRPTTWNERARKAGLQRCGKSCRGRWLNHLRPGIKRGLKFSPHEATLVVQLQQTYGNKWTKIAAHFEGRTDNDVKNLWHGCMRRKRRAEIRIHCDEVNRDLSNKQIASAGAGAKGIVHNDERNHLINQRVWMINEDTNHTLPAAVDRLVSRTEKPTIPTMRTAFSSFFSNDYDLMLLLDQAARSI